MDPCRAADRANRERQLEAAHQIARTLVEEEQDSVTAWGLLGEVALARGKTEDALAAYEQSLKKQPSNNIARKKLAELYARLKRQPTIKVGEGMPAIEISDEEGDEAEDFEAYMEEEEAEASADEDTSD